MQQPNIKHRASRVRVLIALALIVGLVLASLALVPVVSPTAAANIADQLRAWVGPEPVAELESLSFQLQDFLNQFRYQHGDAQPQLSWAGATESPTSVAADSAIAESTPAPDATVAPDATDVPATPTPTDLPEPTVGHLSGGNQLEPYVPTLTPTAGFMWENFGPASAAGAPLARAVLYPDPARPYAQAALVRIDLGHTTLHLQPGVVEPIAARGIPPFPRPGVIPANIQASGTLLAGFNGGFKAINGAYGMMANGVTILPPQNSLATVALYADGSVRMGAWGRDLTWTPNLVAFRQNCPLLVSAGVINPQVQNENRQEWGYTVRNQDTTWRSGLGMSADGRYLFYAVGASLTVESLARALQAAGAYEAMQLDINTVYTRFVTYYPAAGNRLVANKLLLQMAATYNQFLIPYDRDFFYLTLK